MGRAHTQDLRWKPWQASKEGWEEEGGCVRKDAGSESESAFFRELSNSRGNSPLVLWEGVICSLSAV